MACHSSFDVRSSGFKPEKKQFKKIFFFKFTCKFSLDYCDQSSSGLMKIGHSSQSKIYK